MNKCLLKGFLILLFLAVSGFAYSQTVTGKVTDTGGPLPGVSVKEKGTTNATQTDANGVFSLKNVKENAVLVFSYLGFATQEISVNGKSTINVTLSSDQQKLNEVMVIGYGTVKKKDATGAVDQLNAKSFDNISAANPADILRGKVAGVQVTSSSGEPGAGASIRVRGNTSIRAGNQPLIVVDGIPLAGGDIGAGSDVGLGSTSARNPLNFINQNDIESMTVLKDASSTAIYGSRAANGVIIITTKSSKSKEPKLDYSNSFGFSSLATDFKLMDAATFVAKGGKDNGSRSYNWEDAVLQTGTAFNHDLTFSKSTENSSTRLSAGVSNVKGILQKTGMDKYTIAFNNTNQFLDGILKVDAKVNYARIKDVGALTSNNAGYIGNLIGTSLYWNPTNPIYNANGAYNVISTDYLNPVQLLNSYNDFTNTDKLLASLRSTIKINKDLNYQVLFGVENSTSTRRFELLPSIRVQGISASFNNVEYFGRAGINPEQRSNKTLEQTLNYNKEFSENFVFDAILGYSYYDFKSRNSSSIATGFAATQTNLVDNIEGGVQPSFNISSGGSRAELQSFFGRVNATLYKKFLITATLRRDGSTKFGTNDKYGNFPSLGLGYKIVEGKDGLLNNLKLRLNYGITGNQEFDPNQSLYKFSYSSNANQETGNNGNPDLRWEKTTSYGAGIDFALIKNKLTGSVDYFYKNTTDLLFLIQTAATQPNSASNQFRNIDLDLINRGLELGLNYNIVSNEKWNWNVSANASFLSSKIKNSPQTIAMSELNGQGLSGAYSQLLANDQPIYSYFLLDYVRLAADGSSIYRDAAGNETSLALASPRFVDKQALPKMNLGFSTSASYKNFDASVSFYGAFGHYIYNNTANAYFFKGAFLGGRNVPESVATSAQAQSDPNSPSTKFLEKGDFLRMGNISIGYTYSGKALEKLRIKSARFFVNGQNLLLFTNYSGFDPEVDISKSLNGVPSAGIDYLSYPRSKTISFGLNVTL